MVNVRPRSIGLSRNQNVPPVLSKVNGRTVDRPSPQSASSTPKPSVTPHRSQSPEQDEEATQRNSSPEPSPTLHQASEPHSAARELADHPSGRSPVNRLSRNSEKGQNKTDELCEEAEQARTPAVFNPPPLSSESEDDSEAENVVGNARPMTSRSHGDILADNDSEDELSRRGDLRPTIFSSQTARSGSSNMPARNTASFKSSQASNMSQPTSSAGSHLEDTIGHVKRHRAKQTYNSAKPQPGPKRTQKRFEVHEAPASPEKKRATFQIPDVLDSPPPKRREAKFLPGPELASDVESKAEIKAKTSKKRKGRRSIDDMAPEEKKPKAEFWVPDGSPERDHAAKPTRELLRPLSSSSLSDLDSSDDDRKANVPTSQSSVCPWCGKAVRPDTLETFTRGRRLNVQMQTKFCRSHQKQSALEEWHERGYPIIDWGNLPDRLAQHHNHLLGIIKGKSCHFRDTLSDAIRQGKSRTLRKEENLTPGYYGPHGFNIMCDFVVAQFGDLLKTQAVKDRVIAGRGSAAFIQSVLVPELTVQLIKNDMGIEEQKARAVLQESKELGEIVHEEA